VRISGSGIAHNGRNAIMRRRELWMASDAISCLHDALLAVARGDITPDQVRDFFWHGEDIKDAEFIGGVLSFEKSSAAAGEVPT
jgi:hypothetical protein